MIIKRFFCALLAAVMLLSAAGLAEAAPAIAPRTGQFYVDGDTLYMEGGCFSAPVLDIDEAAAAVMRAADILRVQAPSRFEPLRTLTDAAGNIYYVFLQMVGDTTDYGGAAKVITDAEGTVLGLTASVERELPEGYVENAIDAGAAEKIALEHDDGAMLVPHTTELVLLPMERELDMDSEEEKEDWREVYAVYTFTDDDARPFRVHYVTQGGEYLYDMPVKAVGDEASRSGYEAAYVFDNMESVPYTGEVTFSDGSTHQISIDLMRDMDTGVYYLGNLERRIAVADCYEMLFNHGNIVLESSKDNTGWDNTCLLSLYNYCRAWDYYARIGWTGGDGLGTPMLILKDFCDKEHNPIDNAAYAGLYYGWQMFLSSDINDLAQCLDVLAHEFTHCVTHAVMTHNAYQNDYGAINEAMSDIQGNICEMSFGATEDTTWAIGEQSAASVRSMSDPHRYRQPEYSWDLYYIPLVRDPTELNDRGGVHSNSSLLNNVAYRLCADGGMTLEEAQAFWFAVDCTMAPKTDYVQLCQLLPWVLECQGMEKYLPALEAALEATRLGEEDVPDQIAPNRALLTLTLPDEERFTDGNWMLVIPSADLMGAIERVREIANRTGDYADALNELEDIVAKLAPDQVDADGKLHPDVQALTDRLSHLMDEENQQVSEEDKQLVIKLTEWFQEKLSDVFCLATGSAGEDGRTVRMMAQPGVSVPLLVRLEFEPNSMLVKSLSLAVYCFNGWIDLTDIVAELAAQGITTMNAEDEAPAEGEESAPEIPGLDMLMSLLGDEQPGEKTPEGPLEITTEELNFALDKLEEMVTGMRWITDLAFYNLDGGKVNELPDTGLTDITQVEGESVRTLLVDVMNSMTSAEEPEK